VRVRMMRAGSVHPLKSSGTCSLRHMRKRPSLGASPSLKTTGRCLMIFSPASCAPVHTRCI